jgi:hypothetical protein
MPLDTTAGAKPPAPLPLQYVSIELMPLAGGRLSVAMQATLLDEDALDFVGEDLAHALVGTIEEALAGIRDNAGILAAAPQP